MPYSRVETQKVAKPYKDFGTKHFHGLGFQPEFGVEPNMHQSRILKFAALARLDGSLGTKPSITLCLFHCIFFIFKVSILMIPRAWDGTQSDLSDLMSSKVDFQVDF